MDDQAKHAKAFDRMMNVLTVSLASYDTAIGNAMKPDDCDCALCDFVRATRNVVTAYNQEKNAQSTDQEDARQEGTGEDSSSQSSSSQGTSEEGGNVSR